MTQKANMQYLKTYIFILITAGVFFISKTQVQAQPVQGSEEELLALQYFNDKEFDKAVVLYEKLYAKKPSVYLYNYYFECLLAIEDYKKAEKLISGLIKKFPDVYRYQVDEGILYQRTGDVKKAEKSYSSAINNVRPSEENYQTLAQYFLFRNMNDKAVRTYEKGLQNLPDNVSFRYELIRLYSRELRYSEMFEQVYKLIDNITVSISEIQERLQAMFASDSERKIQTEFIAYTLKLVQKTPQNNQYSEMLLWAYLQNSDFDKAMTQAIAMDKRQKAGGRIVIDIIPAYINAKEYVSAERGLQYIISLGTDAEFYLNARLFLQDIQYFKALAVIPPDIAVLKKLEENMIAFLNESGLSTMTLSMLQKLAEIQAYYLDKPLEAKQWIDKAFSITRLSPQQQAALKVQKADIMLLTGEHWDASLLYSQVEKDFKYDTIGFNAKFKNAKFYYYIGEFDYAQTQLKILQGSTSKLIANDAMELNLFIMNNLDYDSSYVPLQYYSRADFHYATKKYNEAISALDSLLAIFPVHPVRDDALFLKANILVKMQKYPEAAENLQKILSTAYKDLLADDALYMLAVMNRDVFKNTVKAMELFWQLVTDFPSSIYAQESREIYRQMRDKKSITP